MNLKHLIINGVKSVLMRPQVIMELDALTIMRIICMLPVYKVPNINWGTVLEFGAKI
jgi:hypothetical protein